MITRKQRTLTPEEAKVQLKTKGWSYRSAAPELRVTATHLALVLNRHRVSRRLLDRIEKLPPRPLHPAPKQNRRRK